MIWTDTVRNSGYITQCCTCTVPYFSKYGTTCQDRLVDWVWKISECYKNTNIQKVISQKRKDLNIRVPTAPGKPGKMMKGFPVMEISWNFEILQNIMEK